MIKNIELIHYLKEDIYKDICHKFNLNDIDRKVRNNWALFDNEKVFKVHMFNINYKIFGHIWFMAVHIDFSKFNCEYKDFSNNLYSYYNELFGQKIASRLPEYKYLNCNYIEYDRKIYVKNSDIEIEKLKSKYPAEQLDRDLWHKYIKPHINISTYICKKDDTHLYMLCKCHGTALKKKIKDKTLHNGTGLIPNVPISIEFERYIIDKEIKKYLNR